MEHMLTTLDNPFNYFTDFKAWYAYDTEKGYNTLGLLDRVIITSDDLSYADQVLAREQAIDEIIKENVTGLYAKVADPNISS